MQYNGKVVIVTGSSSGIGRGTALYFGSQGAKVVLASRNTAANANLKEEIERTGGTAMFVQTDVSKVEDVKRLIDTVIDTYGIIDIAINNAGYEGTPGVKTVDFKIDEWHKVLDVNLNSVYYCMKFEIEEMLKSGGGNIVNISSLAGIRPGGAGIAYHAAKYGVVGISQTAALEYAAENIRINVICPAVIETPMADRAFNTAERRRNAIEMHPIGKLGTVAEVVHAINYLTSNESTFTTGIALPIDGGASL